MTTRKVQRKTTRETAVKAPKPSTKKAVPTKVVAKRPVAKTAVKKAVKRVPPRVVKKVAASAQKPVELASTLVDTEKAVAFAMSIAAEMKKSAAENERTSNREEIRLSRRPTTRAQGKNTVMFPAGDLDDFRKRLLKARAKALNGVDALKATGFNESDDHEADGGDGTNQTLRLQALGHVGNIHRVLQQIDEALHRVDDGSYGVCTSCGQLIRKPRLINQPFVLTCMECQSEMERARK